VLQAEYRKMHQLELNHWWFRGRRRVLVDLLWEVVSSGGDGLKVLDYGCGTGGNTQAYAALSEVIGVEPDQTAVRLAQQRGDGRYCCASGTRLPFCDGSFDVVAASDVLEHIEDDRAAVSEIARVLRPRGTAIITVPAHPWLYSDHDAALHHYRRYTKAALRSLLEQNELRMRRLSYWNATLFPAICLHRLLRRSHHVHEPRSDTAPSLGLVNEALAFLLAGEAAVLRHTSLPWGLSLFGVATRA
jgi:SAM-dependent methyltransferase